VIFGEVRRRRYSVLAHGFVSGVVKTLAYFQSV
jgi:hypothetical protein